MGSVEMIMSVEYGTQDEETNVTTFDVTPIRELVRCKDCIHNLLKMNDQYIYCSRSKSVEYKDFFCADGRRKEEQNDV